MGLARAILCGLASMQIQVTLTASRGTVLRSEAVTLDHCAALVAVYCCYVIMGDPRLKNRQALSKWQPERCRACCRRVTKTSSTGPASTPCAWPGARRRAGAALVAAFIGTAFVQDDAETARAQWREVADQVAPRCLACRSHGRGRKRCPRLHELPEDRLPKIH